MNYFIYNPNTNEQLGFNYDITSNIIIEWVSDQMESRIFNDDEIDTILMVSKTGMYFKGSVSFTVKAVVDYLFKNRDVDLFCVAVNWNPNYMVKLERSNV